MELSKQQQDLCNTSQWDFSHPKALFINCTLKRSPAMSHTDGLLAISKTIMEKNRVQVDAAWLGEAGPGPSYMAPGSGGPANDFTNRNTTFMTWNLMHIAKMIKDAGGLPAHGNQRASWDAGCRFDFDNPDYR